MTKTAGWAALAALTFVPSIGLAQDMGGQGPRGGFELEYIGTDNSGGAYLNGDIDLMQRGLAVGAFSLGFDLGVDATFDLKDGGDRYAFFGAVVVDPGFGDIAVGAPRSIGSLLTDRPVFAGNHALDRELDTIMPPMSDSLAKSQKMQSYGVRFDSTAGALRYGASVQRLDGMDGTFMQAGAQYAFGGGQVGGVIEKQSNVDGLNMLLGVSGQMSQVDYGLYLGHQDRLKDTTGLQATLGYAVADNLRVGGDFGVKRANGTEETFVGASAQYDFSSGVYAQFGVTDGNNRAAMWDASVGFKF
jgi:hypothetical protein